MNILIPDSWLREFLKTEATSQQIKEYLSLCGPSVERVHKNGDEIVYDIEITSNRPDSMSVFGIAREAAAILPRFGIEAILINDPYKYNSESDVILASEKRTRPGSVIISDSGQARMTNKKTFSFSGNKNVTIKTDPILNPRWTSIILENVTVKQSPDWLRKKLELTGIRSLNNIIDITNYLMRSYGQPAHAFDFDEIKPGKNKVPTMILRASRKGEEITTLDGKTHLLQGGDIVIEDGYGRLIDLCGIMGAKNSSIKSSTKTVVLFIQTYNPVHIRKTSMSLAHRTEAAQLFEKGLDSELVMPTVLKGIGMVKELAGGRVASQIYDIYPHPYKHREVSVKLEKVAAYVGAKLSDEQFKNYLTPLGFGVNLNRHSGGSEGRLQNPDSGRSASWRIARMTENLTVTVPSFRPDIEIDVDIIEEIARIYGYHRIAPTLPDTEPPVTILDSALQKEEEVKVRLRDWGYTETYTYSMISEELMDLFNLDKKKAYKIANPLSSEWVYMRPTLTPSLLMALRQNIHLREEIKLFELSMIYRYRENYLPQEEPSLVAMWKGDKFLEAKGITEALFLLFGIPFPLSEGESTHLTWYSHKALKLGEYGALGVMDQTLLTELGIKEPVTRLYLDFAKLVRDAKTTKQYIPIPKYPPVIEDFSFVLPPKTPVGEVMSAIKSVSTLVHSVTILSRYESTVSFRVNYLDRQKQLLDSGVVEIRKLIKETVASQFAASLKI